MHFDTENNYEGIGNSSISVTGKDTIFVLGNFIPSPNSFTILSEFKTNNNNDISKIKTNPIYHYNIEVPLDNGIIVTNSLMDVYIDGYLNIMNMWILALYVDQVWGLPGHCAVLLDR